jgi:NitT/TauT family transport system substrate-binding protein
MKRIAMLLILACVLFTRGASASEVVEVLDTNSGNLQHLSFWVAKGGGLFEKEGLEIQMIVPLTPQGALEPMRTGAAKVAVLPPPICLELIADGVPIVLVANLLANDAINLVVRRSVVEERNLNSARPLAERLRAMRGLRLGVAPNPPTRLRALFASAGLDADRDLQLVILRGKEQNAAFAEGTVDGLYAHTPYLETAIVDQGAVVVVNQSAGEVPELAKRQIHALVVNRDYAKRHPDRVVRLVRAVDRAEQRIRADHSFAVNAVLHEFPRLDPRKVETIVSLYAPAIPTTPYVDAAGLRTAWQLYPAARPKPALQNVDFEAFVDNRFAEQAVKDRHPRAWGRRSAMGVAVVALVSLAGLGILLLRRKRAGGAGPVQGEQKESSS